MAFQNRNKFCYFKENGVHDIDYKDVKLLRRFVNDQGKIMPRRITGTSAKMHRKLVKAIKRSRSIALMPYVERSIEKKQIEKNRSVREVAAHEKIPKKLSNIEITIEAQVGEEEKMFGSITTIDIQKSLEAKGITVDRSSISLENPIKALGIYHVPIRVTSELSGDVKIYVIKS